MTIDFPLGILMSSNKKPQPQTCFSRRRTFWQQEEATGGRRAWARNLAALLTSCVTLGGLHKAQSLGFLLCRGRMENGKTSAPGWAGTG